MGDRFGNIIVGGSMPHIRPRVWVPLPRWCTMSTTSNDDRNSGVNFVTGQYVITTKGGTIGKVVFHTTANLIIQWEDSSGYGQTTETQEGPYPRYFRVINLPPHAKAQHPCTIPVKE